MVKQRAYEFVDETNEIFTYGVVLKCREADWDKIEEFITDNLTAVKIILVKRSPLKLEIVTKGDA